MTNAAVDVIRVRAASTCALGLRCDRCSNQHPTAKSYTTAGVCYTLCDTCSEEFDRPATPDRPRDERDISLDWLF